MRSDGDLCAGAGRPWTGNLTKADLQFDSPYNTYRYPGLPPGPIASPGRASLGRRGASGGRAVPLFVSRNDGTHVFSSTLEEHNHNVAEWQGGGGGGEAAAPRERADDAEPATSFPTSIFRAACRNASGWMFAGTAAAAASAAR